MLAKPYWRDGREKRIANERKEQSCDITTLPPSRDKLTSARLGREFIMLKDHDGSACFPVITVFCIMLYDTIFFESNKYSGYHDSSNVLS